MRVKIVSEDFKKLARGVLPFAGGSGPVSGAIGLSFTKKHLVIRAFAGVWAWGEVEYSCEEYIEDIDLVINSKGMDIALLCCGADDTVIDVSAEQLKVGSATIRSLSTRTVDDLTPNIDLLDARWIILPGQAKEVVKVSLTGSLRPLWLLPDVILALDTIGVCASAFPLDWELEQRVAVPFEVAHIISAKEGEVSFCILRDIIVFSIHELHVATPQFGEAPDRVTGEIEFNDGWSPISSLGTVSSDIRMELNVAILQSDTPIIFIWTDGGPGLHFYSSGSEIGSSRGSLCSSISELEFCGNAGFIKRMIPKDQMWQMATVALGANDEGEKDPAVLMVKTEGGVFHYVNSLHPREDFQVIIDEHDYKEQVNETE